jgi:hypothetical protein
MTDVPLPKFGDAIKVNAVVMTFAVHYIVSDLDSMNNFADLVDSVLEVGGVLILTLLDGRRVFDLLKNIKKGDSWDAPSVSGSADNAQNDTKKYSIRKLYDDHKFKDFGLRISLIHPFSAGEYYEENLVGISGLEEVFIKRGYKVRQDGGFLDYIDKFAKFNKDMHGKMSTEDKAYSGLYQYVTLWRSR